MSVDMGCTFGFTRITFVNMHEYLMISGQVIIQLTIYLPSRNYNIQIIPSFLLENNGDDNYSLFFKLSFLSQFMGYPCYKHTF